LKGKRGEKAKGAILNPRRSHQNWGKIEEKERGGIDRKLRCTSCIDRKREGREKSIFFALNFPPEEK